MPLSQEQLERLINRRLDSALSSTEEIELAAELARNPAAQRLLEDYAQLDRLSAESLDAAWGEPCEVAVGLPPQTGSPTAQRPRYHRAWWAMPAAVAAALVAMVWLTPDSPPEKVVSNRLPRTQLNANVGSEILPVSANAGLDMVPRLGIESRTIDRDYYWLVGKDGRIYLIERQVDRVLERPAQQWNVRTKDGGV
ncbi:MAG: hypothetical protein IID37_13015 [Planctomycetes bacterium]|nr:hypothetical protein [Planctomycetota bacterium]